MVGCIKRRSERGIKVCERKWPKVKVSIQKKGKSERFSMVNRSKVEASLNVKIDSQRSGIAKSARGDEDMSESV